MKLRFSEPVLVSMGPACTVKGWKGWGPYQFPELRKLPDGRLLYIFNIGEDSANAYGENKGCYLSHDGGKTWTPASYRNFEVPETRLANGDSIGFLPWASQPTEGLEFPEPLGKTHLGHTIYRRADLQIADYPENWLLRRVSKEHPEGVIEETKLNWPDMICSTVNRVLIRPDPRGRLRVGPDGTLWMPSYDMASIFPDGRFSPYLSNNLFRSVDNGHTWDLVHSLCFDPPADDENHTRFEGYGENDVTVAPDGSLIRITRTGSTTPSWIVRSADGGKTWSEPKQFDDHGVWPCLVTLDCGVTLVSYGRPGLQVRATSDPSCQVWEDPVELIHTRPECALPKNDMTMEDVGTCGYTTLLALDHRTAALAYSDFRIKDAYGTTRKCMMYRTITIED